jgi:acetyl esterase
MLDQDAKALLDVIASRNIPSYHTLSPAEARTFYKERRFFTQPDPEPVARVENFSVPSSGAGIGVRWYRPQTSAPGAVLPALVYYHGGGHTIGDLDTHDSLCRQLCNLSGWAVFSVDYRLGPEHRFPAAVDDSYAALKWIADHATTLMIDTTRIAVGGDSAGGNLATVMALMSRDRNGPPLAYQLLIYPVTDFRFQTKSHQTLGENYLLTREVIDYFTDCYLGPDADRLDWRISPSLAANHGNLPPALVITAGYDPLCDEGRAYAELLQKAGNHAELLDYSGQIHGFITMGRVIGAANDAVAQCAARLKSL